MSCKYCGGRGYLEIRYPVTGLVSTEPCHCKDGEKGTLFITIAVIVILTVTTMAMGWIDAQT